MVTTIPPLKASQDLAVDLAGTVWPQPTMRQTQRRIKTVIQQYLSMEYLRDRLADLPDQLEYPTARPWPVMDWKSIITDHIIGLSPEIFLQILLGIINTELPIRGYSQTSRQYLESVHPGLAYFVGGKVDQQGTLLEKGIWEREEERHGPALVKVYRQLSGEKPLLNPHEPRPYTPSTEHFDDLYRHGMHRVATEYSATCLYIWLMAHTTGPLQQVFLELLKDEINHMTKFWGVGIWLFPTEHRGAMVRRVIASQLASLFPCLDKKNAPENDVIDPEEGEIDMSFITRMLHTLGRMKGELAWSHWSWQQQWEFFYTFLQAIVCLNSWSQTLTPTALNNLLEDPPVSIL